MHTVVMKNRVESGHYLYNDHEKQGSMGISMLPSMDLYTQRENTPSQTSMEHNEENILSLGHLWILSPILA